MKAGTRPGIPGAASMAIGHGGLRETVRATNAVLGPNKAAAAAIDLSEALLRLPIAARNRKDLPHSRCLKWTFSSGLMKTGSIHWRGRLR